MGRPNTTLEQRFWAKVRKGTPEECWLWTGATLKSGYGYMDKRNDPAVGRLLTAHRLSVEFSGRQIPDGSHVLHQCDNPACVNPAHLSVGTHRDNMADMVRKGRQAEGIRNGRRKLDASDVIIIRSAAGRRGDLAQQFGVHVNEIGRIKNRKTWRSLA